MCVHCRQKAATELHHWRKSSALHAGQGRACCEAWRLFVNNHVVLLLTARSTAHWPVEPRSQQLAQEGDFEALGCDARRPGRLAVSCGTLRPVSQ